MLRGDSGSPHQVTKFSHILGVFNVFRLQQAGRRQPLGCLKGCCGGSIQNVPLMVT